MADRERAHLACDWKRDFGEHLRSPRASGCFRCISTTHQLWYRRSDMLQSTEVIPVGRWRDGLVGLAARDRGVLGGVYVWSAVIVAQRDKVSEALNSDRGRGPDHRGAALLQRGGEPVEHGSGPGRTDRQEGPAGFWPI
jgi:hypothetical protein